MNVKKLWSELLGAVLYQIGEGYHTKAEGLAVSFPHIFWNPSAPDKLVLGYLAATIGANSVSWYDCADTTNRGTVVFGEYSDSYEREEFIFKHLDIIFRDYDYMLTPRYIQAQVCRMQELGGAVINLSEQMLSLGQEDETAKGAYWRE